jgi:hypothetical protein
MRVLKDVVIQRTDREELLAISHAAGVIGEEMTLDLMGSGETLALKVNVVESRPVIIDGSVRHRIRLRVLAAAAEVVVSSHSAGVAAPPSSAEVM